VSKEPTYKPKGLTYRVQLPGDQDRLTEAILYVSEKCEKAPRFGLIKLNKIIWRADFTAFAARKVPVTGRAYQKLRYGPAPIEMLPLLNELKQKGFIEIDDISVTDVVERRVIAVVPPHHRFFSPSDLEFLDASIRYYWDKSGMEASEDSHGIGWETREIGDAMPYELAFLSDAELQGEQLAKILALAEERRWASS